jgi:hypothetical protein
MRRAGARVPGSARSALDARVAAEPGSGAGRCATLDRVKR